MSLQTVKIVFLVVLITQLLFSQATANEVCDNIGCLTDFVRSHTDILNNFPEYQEQTDELQNEVRKLRIGLESIKGNMSSLTEYQNMKVNLSHDVTELKIVSHKCLQKFESLDTYQGTTDYLVDDVAQLKGSVEILKNSLRSIESHKEKTDILQNEIMTIKESVSNYSCKRDESAHLKIETLYKENSLRQNETEIQLQKVYDLTQMQNKTTEKLNGLASSLDQVTQEQYIIHKKLHKEESTETLSSLISAVQAIATQQQLLKTKLEELSEEFQQLRKPQASLPLIQMVQSTSTQSTPTIPTTPSTQRPSSERRVIRKHAHARGTNINLTV